MRLFPKTTVLFIALVGLSCASPAKQPLAPPAPSAAATPDAEFQKTANEIYEAHLEHVPTRL